ncbi:MAG: hypothetical protein V2I36_12915 [Desulfopila sp.]|jgi:hypothetical protein|nr:hypothetical protein [Desulfopila sp.]
MNPKRHHWPCNVLALFFVGLLLINLTGCNGGDGDSAGKVLHSCELFSIDEIETIIGAPVDTPPRETHKVDEEGNFWMSMCNYYAPGPGVSVGFMIQPLTAKASPEEALNSYISSLQSSVPDYQMTPVPDIGQKAIWSADSGQLTIFTDSHMVLVSTMEKGAAEEKTLALAREIGLLTLEKLR